MSDRQVALVTGCSEGGIGFNFCEKLAGRGCIVYATARSVDSMKAFQHEEIRTLALDVKNEEQVQSVVKTIMDKEGRIDIVINNAGVLEPGPLIDYTVDQVKEIFDVNVFGIHRVCRAVVPHMAARKKGTIVNIGSVVGEFPTPWMGAYDGSKAAVRIMTEVLAMECSPFNIRVMLVVAGSVESQLIKKLDEYQVLPNSIYLGYAHNIRDRLEIGRDKDAMPADEFAEGVVSEIFKTTVARYLWLGGKAWLTRMTFPYLPRTWALSIAWKMFSKPGVVKKQA